MHKAWRCCDCTRTKVADPVWQWLKGRTWLYECCRCWSFSLGLHFRATLLRFICKGNGYIWIHRGTEEVVRNREWMELFYKGVRVSPPSLECLASYILLEVSLTMPWWSGEAFVVFLQTNKALSRFINYPGEFPLSLPTRVFNMMLVSGWPWFYFDPSDHLLQLTLTKNWDLTSMGCCKLLMQWRVYYWMLAVHSVKFWVRGRKFQNNYVAEKRSKIHQRNKAI